MRCTSVCVNVTGVVLVVAAVDVEAEIEIEGCSKAGIPSVEPVREKKEGKGDN